jgi:hypothetical protein
MGEAPRANRRRSYRAGVHGCAIVHAPGGIALRCEVIDLSLGGVRLVTMVADDPRLSTGTEVAIELECCGAGWVTQRGVVTRHHRAQLVVEFYALSAEVEDLIEDEILGAVEAERAPRVVVVDGAEERRHQVADQLRRLGCCSLEAATPLEAIELIERSRNHVCAVALSESLTQTQADELVEYLHDAHPEVRVARIEHGGEVAQLARRLRKPQA